MGFCVPVQSSVVWGPTPGAVHAPWRPGGARMRNRHRSTAIKATSTSATTTGATMAAASSPLLSFFLVEGAAAGGGLGGLGGGGT